jgi:hypothetical protein
MKAQMCRFKRSAEDKWETGIMIGVEHTETMLIVDQEGKHIAHETNVYDFRLVPEEGCFEYFEARPPEIKPEASKPDVTAMRQSMLKQNLIHLLVAHAPISSDEYFDIVDADIDLEHQVITFRFATLQRPETDDA